MDSARDPVIAGTRWDKRSRRTGTVRENVTITYRGARYEFGQGQHFYGIWAVGSPGPQPLEWWPQTPAGYSGAWSRFTTIETPGSIAPVGQPAAAPAFAGPAGYPSPAAAPQNPPAHNYPPQGYPQPGGPPPPGYPQPGYQPQGYQQQGFAPQGVPHQAFAPYGPMPGGPGYGTAAPWARRDPEVLPARPAGQRSRLASGLIALGVLLGVVGLFPTYDTGASLASNNSTLVPHVLYLLAWLAGAGLLLYGGNRARAGALLAVSTSVVTFGLFASDLGTSIASPAAATGAGLYLGLIGWLVCAVGSGLALQPGPDGGFSRPRGARAGTAVMLALAAVGTAITFAPAWDRFVLRTPNAGVVATTTGGDTFSLPGSVMAGDLITMVALVAVVVVAALWRPARLGAALVAGVVIVMAAQVVSAVIQLGQTTPPGEFNIPAAQARAAGLTISNGVTPVFWLYVAFLVVLAGVGGWMFVSAPRIAPDGILGPTLGPDGPPPAADPVRPGDEASDLDDGLSDREEPSEAAATVPDGGQPSAAHHTAPDGLPTIPPAPDQAD